MHACIFTALLAPPLLLLNLNHPHPAHLSCALRILFFTMQRLMWPEELQRYAGGPRSSSYLAILGEAQQQLGKQVAEGSVHRRSHKHTWHGARTSRAPWPAACRLGTLTASAKGLRRG